MPPLSEHDVYAQVARDTGLSIAQVAHVVESLAELAYQEARTGFHLPGFGEFSVVKTPEKKGVNPFTGEPMVFKGRLKVEFSASPKGREGFLSGGNRERYGGRKTAPEKKALSEIKLVPDVSDMRQAKLDPKRPSTLANKLGGNPDWLQSPPDDLVCCGTKMSLYGQFDSAIGGDFVLMDVGRLYVFLCWECLTPKGVIQSY